MKFHWIIFKRWDLILFWTLFVLIEAERRFLFARGVLFILLYLYSLYIVVTLMSEVFKKLPAFDLSPKCIKSDAKKGRAEKWTWKNWRREASFFFRHAPYFPRPSFYSRSVLQTDKKYSLYGFQYHGFLYLNLVIVDIISLPVLCWRVCVRRNFQKSFGEVMLYCMPFVTLFSLRYFHFPKCGSKLT